MDVGLVCDACSALTPIGVPQCARCGQPVALDPRPKRGSVHPPNVAPNVAPNPNGNGSPQPLTTNAGTAIGTTCGKCSSMIPPNFKFCPTCGNKVTTTAPAGQGINFEVQTRVGP